jgi:hypothetical protein
MLRLIYATGLSDQIWRKEMKKKLFIFVFLAAMVLMATGCAPGAVAQVNTPIPGTPAPSGQINVPGVSIQVYAPGPNPLLNVANAQDRVAGFLLGLWHGIISPVTLVLSFFNTGAQMYEVHNDGNQYNLGFLLGVALIFVILGALIGSRRR